MSSEDDHYTGRCHLLLLTRYVKHVVHGSPIPCAVPSSLLLLSAVLSAIIGRLGRLP